MNPPLEKSIKVVSFECSTLAYGGRQLLKIVFTMLLNILKVIQFISGANNNCIDINKCEI